MSLGGALLRQVFQVFPFAVLSYICHSLLFLAVLAVFSDSLALSASIPLFFVPTYPLGADFGAKTKTTLENLSKKRLVKMPEDQQGKYE